MKNRIVCVMICLSVMLSAYSDLSQWALYGVKLGGFNNKGFSDGLAVFKDYKLKMCGAINRAGEVVIEAQFKDLSDFENGMAVASLSYNQKGIINTRGEWLLQPVYKDIKKDEDHRGVYIVTDENYNEGLFYNGRMVIPTDAGYNISTWNFPFVECDKIGDNMYLNILTGERWDYVFRKGSLFVASNLYVENSEEKYGYYKLDGSRIDVSKNNISSQGLTPYKDNETKLYGLKRAKTGDIVVPAQYKEMYGIWINDVIVAKDGQTNIILDAYGREIPSLSHKPNLALHYFEKNYIIAQYADVCGLYDYKGNVILPEKYEIISCCYDMPGDWYSVKPLGEDNYKLFNAAAGKFYESGTYSDGMLKINDTQNQKSYYVNVATGQIIDKNFDHAGEFSEGVAWVMFKGNKYGDFIDKNGKVVFTGSEQCNPEMYSKFSEGVVKAKDETNYVDGYIYNPLGSGDYVYKQKSGQDDFVYRCYIKGSKEFEKENYAYAKEYYYRIMMCAPEEYRAISAYASCLYNMGYYEEAIEAYSMALDINPNDEHSKKWRDSAQSIVDAQWAAEQEAQEVAQNQQSTTFWDALGSFCTFLGNAMGGYTGSYSYDNSFSTSYSSGSSSVGAGNYQSEYDRWEQRAKSNYETLTNLGYSASNKRNDKSGSTGQSMNTGNYVMQKKALRDAQREMRNIRQKAARAGVHITQSKWETATVNY